MKITLDPTLERALLRAISEGVCDAKIVDAKELSKKGQAVYGSLKYLIEKGVATPLKPASIVLTAQSLFGFPKASAESYLQSFRDLQTGTEISTILRASRDKALLVGLINKAGDQLASGVLDRGSLEALFSASSTSSAKQFQSISASTEDEFSPPPVGLELASLPEISRAANGFAGIWVVGGEPGLGKSTLAVQIALDVSAHCPVVYYDIDGTGTSYFQDRLRSIFDSNLRKFKAALKTFYLRESVEDLEADLKRAELKPPAMIVIDSIQTLPHQDVYAKDPTGDWLDRFKRLVKMGYTLLLISEKPRTQYGKAELGGFKNSGAIEYGGTICAHLIADEDDENILKVMFVKNRHGEKKGHVANLIRDEDKIYWFNEEKVRNYVERPEQQQRPVRGARAPRR